ncbi:MAG: RNA 2',3'-cyclic phosphodiesterase [Nanoarchaeota archaeon]|nr:RNA 2',3'-cyclic phosphodiesterase [Nanoarchaeota archaeon]
MVRIFIALDIPRECINEIKSIQELLRKRVLFTGKFTEPENLHLTLKFLGEISEEQVEEVKKKISLIKLESFYCEIGEVGVFSKSFTEKQGFSVSKNFKKRQKFSGIKIIWIKLNGKEIFKLQKEIDEKLKDMFPVEARFMSHITIARVKNVPDKKALIEYLKSIKPKKLKFYIKEFYLKKSELLSEGPVYSDIEKYSLF